MCNRCCKNNSKNEGNNISLNFEEQWIKVGEYSSKLIELKGGSKPNGIVNRDYRDITTFFNIKKEIFQRITANSKVVLLKRENKRYEKYIIFAVRTNNDKFYLGLSKNYSDTFNTSSNGLFEGHLDTVEIKMIYNKNDIEASAQMFKDNVNVIKIIFIKNFDTKDINNMYAMFMGCIHLEELNLANLNTKNVTNMKKMFSDCNKLTYLNVSNFDTSKVENMNYMFYGCESLTSLNLSKFNTKNVIYIYDMFCGCSSLTSLNLSNFNTSNVTDMSGMFCGCSNLKKLNLSKFNTKNVNNMQDMFYGCSSLTSLNLSNFNTMNVTNMESMFEKCSKLEKLDIANFNTKNVKNMNNIFREVKDNLTISCNDKNKISSLINYTEKDKHNLKYKNLNIVKKRNSGLNNNTNYNTIPYTYPNTIPNNNLNSIPYTNPNNNTNANINNDTTEISKEGRYFNQYGPNNQYDQYGPNNQYDQYGQNNQYPDQNNQYNQNNLEIPENLKGLF